jgi:hypothetical protein
VAASVLQVVFVSDPNFVSNGPTISGSITPSAGGSKIHIYASNDSGAGPKTITVADNVNAGNYTGIDDDTFTADTSRLANFYKNGVAGSATTVTATWSASTVAKFLVLIEVGGAAGDLDGHSGSGGVGDQASVATTANAVTSGAIVPANVPFLIIGCSLDLGGGTPIVGTSPIAFTDNGAGITFGGLVAALCRIESARLTTGNGSNQFATFTASIAARDHQTFAVAFDENASLPPLTWLPSGKTIAQQAQPATQSVTIAPPLPPPAAPTVTPLSWAPRLAQVAQAAAIAGQAFATGPVFVPVAPPQVRQAVVAPAVPPLAGQAQAVEPFASAIPPPILSWHPRIDRGVAAPPSVAVAAMVAPVLPPAAPSVPALSWQGPPPPPIAILPTLAAIAAAVEPLSPALAPPILSWQARGMPAVLPIAGAPVAGVVAPIRSVLPVPPLSWAPTLDRSVDRPQPIQVAAGRVVQTPFTYAYPLKRSSNARYLVDQNGVEYPILGRALWEILTETASEARRALDDTVAKKFTAIEMRLINSDGSGGVRAPFANNGTLLPFTNTLGGATWTGGMPPTSPYGNINTDAPDLTTPDATYWAFVDAFLNDCLARQILVFAFPAYVGFKSTTQGWMDEMVANGTTRMQTYGAFIANRYKNQPNIVWMFGGDRGTGSNPFTAGEILVEQALIDGMKSVSGQLSINIDAEWNTDAIFTDQTDFNYGTTYQLLNGAYSFQGLTANQARRAFTDNRGPAHLLEGPYDEEGPDGNNVNTNATQPVRRFNWWGWLGSIGGYVTGNGFVWPFNKPGNANDWDLHLNTIGAQDLGRLNGYVRSHDWKRLIPSGLGGMRTLITAGGSTVTSSDYVGAACSSDGKLLVAYVPPAHTGNITVDCGSLSGNARGRWFNPFTASYTDITSGNYTLTPTSQTFTPPGDNGSGFSDWVLELDTLDPPALSWQPSEVPPVLSRPIGQGTTQFAPIFPPAPVVVPVLSWAPHLISEPVRATDPAPFARLITPFAPVQPVPALSWAPRGAAAVAAPAPIIQDRVAAPLLVVPDLSWLPRGQVTQVSDLPPGIAWRTQPLQGAIPPPLSWLAQGAIAPPTLSQGLQGASVGPLLPPAAGVPLLSWLGAVASGVAAPPIAGTAQAIGPFAPLLPVPALSWLSRLIANPVLPLVPGQSATFAPITATLAVPILSWLPRQISAPVLPLVPGQQQVVAPPQVAIAPPVLSWRPVDMRPPVVLPEPSPIEQVVAPPSTTVPPPVLSWAPSHVVPAPDLPVPGQGTREVGPILPPPPPPVPVLAWASVTNIDPPPPIVMGVEISVSPLVVIPNPIPILPPPSPALIRFIMQISVKNKP